MMLYLHGFRSSPESFKSQMLAKAYADRGLSDQWRCPQLPASPKAALEQSLDLAKELVSAMGKSMAELTVTGSSLGGFYAIALAERLGCRAVLLNPAVFAARDLATQVGEHTMYHSAEPMVFKPAYVDELTAMTMPAITRPERYLLIAATGDEVLDWREMVAFMAGAHHIIVPGSDHGLSDFAIYMPRVLEFAGVTTSTED